MKITCLALDDEPLALEVIENYASKIPYLDLRYVLTDPIKAIECIENEPIQLVFLDIQMPELTGIEVSKIITKKPYIIFTTAYSDFAVESYELNAVDYLLKPIPFERFIIAIQKIKVLLEKQSNASIPSAINITPVTDYIFVKSNYKTIKIDIKDIIYIESQRDYVIFHLIQKEIHTLMNIKELEVTLPNNLFVRIHRSFIIALDKIVSIERNNVTTTKKAIPIGESYREIFLSKIESI